jgi:hypothetical protein
MKIDWTKPLEMDDGTPVVLRDYQPYVDSRFVRLESVNDSHPAFDKPGDRERAALINTGKLEFAPQYSVRNRVATPLDLSKPLVLARDDRPVELIAITTDGNLLVSVLTVGAFQWYLFDKQGNFVRSRNSAGSGMKLINKPPVVKHDYINYLQPDGSPVRIDFTLTDGKVTDVGIVK